ncbi:MAG TPA: DinB family protein [Gemmatimonadales bacterium]|nr:DinB family protein [Gemmatimonadales bacterium]
MPDHLRALFAHLRWADARALAALRVSNGQPPQARVLFAHVLGAEETWLARVEGRVPRLAVWPDLDVEQCVTWAERIHQALDALVAGLDADRLADEVAYVNSEGRAFHSTRRDILLHMAMHGQYHRGQVALLLRASGFDPAATDYIAWARGAPAATRQPAG